MSLYQSPTNQKPETSPLNPIKDRLFQALERPKEFGLVAKRYTYAFISNSDNQPVILELTKEPNLTTAR
jgi:hypothetical protein